MFIEVELFQDVHGPTGERLGREEKEKYLQQLKKDGIDITVVINTDQIAWFDVLEVFPTRFPSATAVHMSDGTKHDLNISRSELLDEILVAGEMADLDKVTWEDLKNNLDDIQNAIHDLSKTDK